MKILMGNLPAIYKKKKRRKFDLKNPWEVFPKFRDVDELDDGEEKKKKRRKKTE